jgi:ubiquinone/menaquinone biosynthesis C-methylase UbiE
MSDLDKGFHESPNIHLNSDIYEIENIACDPENKIEAFIESRFELENKNILDIGCGTGFHLPYYSKSASHIFGVEPFDVNRLKGMKRICDLGLENISLLKGTAEALSLNNDLIDFAYARFAYFWGEGCEKGLEEVFRVLKQGGTFLMIDNNLEMGTFGSWVKKSFSHSDSKQSEVDQFWRSNGFELETIDSNWSFNSREDLERVILIEFPEKIAREIISEHSGTTIDYTFNLYFKTK